MASDLFSSAQRIIAQVLTFLQSGAQNRTADLITDTFSSGINNSTVEIGEGFTIVPGSNNTSINPSVNITGGGLAIDSLGNRIFISTTDTTLYNASNTIATTNDGLGHFLSTPQSTGVINIPVVQSTTNYLWINYLATIDTTQFTLNSETNAKIFYAQTDGYNIQVTQTNIAPNVNSIFLGSVTATGVAIVSSNISQLGRTYYKINPAVVPITTPFNNGSNRTPTYAQNSTYTLDAHIKAIGTGTGISPTNPHNMSLTDLGVSKFDTVNEHRLLEHGGGGNTSVAANAIIAGVPGTPYPNGLGSSAMAPTINIVNPGSDTITIWALSSTEFAIVNGSAFNANNIFGNVPTNATIMFPDSSGTYDVYWDSNAQVFGVTTGDVSTDVTKLWLATVTYTFVGHGPSDHNALSSLIDRRRIGSTTHLLQRWLNNSRPGAGSSLNPQSGEFGFNLSSGLLEYWDGSAWQQPVNASSNSFVPTGTVLEFAGSIAPSGFLLANGGSYTIVSQPNLFAVIGYTFGGAGPNFNVPNRVNNVGVGFGGSIAPALGSTSGATTASGTTGLITEVSTRTVSSSGLFTANEAMQDIGTGSSFTIRLSEYDAPVTLSTVQPSIGMNYIIKT